MPHSLHYIACACFTLHDTCCINSRSMNLLISEDLALSRHLEVSAWVQTRIIPCCINEVIGRVRSHHRGGRKLLVQTTLARGTQKVFFWTIVVQRQRGISISSLEWGPTDFKIELNFSLAWNAVQTPLVMQCHFYARHSTFVLIIAAPSAIRLRASPRSRHPQTNGALKLCLLIWCKSSAGVKTYKIVLHLRRISISTTHWHCFLYNLPSLQALYLERLERNSITQEILWIIWCDKNISARKFC